ncbi:hypothetical protein [Halobellus sp. GM3]|uniref:hypothetical protein n=1 Tax=Halobellus sp. GM3 TaxID=3458410 RepID=UPI00403D7EF7
MELELSLRQVLPLALLYAADERKIKGKTRFTKLAFLAEEELASRDVDIEQEITYEFYPYDYGPFSKQLLNDLEMFDQKGVINISEKETYRSTRYDYELHPAAVEAFENVKDSNEVKPIFQVAKQVVEEFGSIGIRSLLDYVYEEHPKYQKNSVYY